MKEANESLIKDPALKDALWSLRKLLHEEKPLGSGYIEDLFIRALIETEKYNGKS